MPYYTYILFSKKTDRYYIGSTQNIHKRIERHNAGVTKSTKGGRPWNLVYYESFETKTEAIKRENYLKRMKSRIFVEKIIKDPEREL